MIGLDMNKREARRFGRKIKQPVREIFEVSDVERMALTMGQ